MLTRRSKFRAVLPQCDNTVIVLETNFTTLEVEALRTCWRHIEPKIKKISKQLAIDIYTEDHEWVELFRYDGQIDNNTLVYHPLWLLNIYDAIITSNLKRNYDIAKILEPIMKERWFHSIPIPFLEAILNYVRDAVLEDVQNHLSATIASAFDKLNHAILSFSRIERRNTQTLERYSKHS